MTPETRGRQSDGVATIAYPAALVAEYRRLATRAALLEYRVHHLAMELRRADRRLERAGLQVDDDSWSDFAALVGAAPLHAAINRMIEVLGEVV